MVSAGEAVDRVQQHFNFIDAAREAGIQHVVYTSFFGAAADSVFTLGRDHWATEQHLRQSGMDFTILRDNFYIDILPQLAGNDGVIRGPAGNGGVSAVARDDVARSAVVVLRNPAAHIGRTYDLTGPEVLTLAEAAAVISTATGRSVRYQPETSDEAYASRAHFGAPRWQLDAWVSTYSAIATGNLSGTTTAVHDLTGRPPLSLADFLKN
ncbi:SDR family oxidoreductase [Arthrobacter sp. H5]|uniref:SDR family oxidoreductase n=1 Tax=Arthrobacter sp. H5 TaxID=1267973 RepID=UPI0004BA790B